MIYFLARRFMWMIITLWAVFTVCFFLMRAVPGGPFDQERKLDPQVEKNLRERYHMNDPILKQYWTHLSNIAMLDPGYPIRIPDMSIGEIVRQGFPISASLGILAMGFALTLGLTAGIVSAIKRYTLIDFSLMTVATVGIALPNFVIAGIVILLFVFLIPLFPAGGWGTISQMILPAFCLGAPYAAYIARLMRTGMLDVLSQDYIRTAYAKGLMPRTVVIRHAIRGAILPVISFLGPAVAGILIGSLVVEKIFVIPGLGVHFIEAATLRDYPLAIAMELIYTILLFSANTIVDMAYSLIDPRVKLE